MEGMEPPGHQGMIQIDSVDVSERDDVQKLHGGAVGLAGVLFLTVTGAAPISAMLFNTPLSVGYGNGIGTPAGFAFATVILAIFSVGYVSMARKVTAAGGFYSFISHGLGRELGMASGLAMVVAYSVFEASLCGGFAYFGTLKLAQYGYHPSWVLVALFMVVLISILAFFDVHISARVLGLALISEVIALLIFDLVVFAQGGHNIQAAAINPINAFKNLPASGSGASAVAAGAWAVGVFFAFWSWVGFEMAPNYGEESRNPKKIVPRAMYVSVIGLGIFYTITSWAALSSYFTTHDAALVAVTDPASLLSRPGQGVRQPVPERRDELPDHHRLVRVRHGLPQHHGPLPLLAGTREGAAVGAGPDAHEVPQPAHRLDRAVRDRGPDRAGVLLLHHDGFRLRPPRRRRPTCSSTAWPHSWAWC